MGSKDLSVDLTENIFTVLFDIIKKFPKEACLKVIDAVHGYRIIKEEMKPPRIYHKICENECTSKFSYHTTCTIPPKKVRKRPKEIQYCNNLLIRGFRFLKYIWSLQKK